MYSTCIFCHQTLGANEEIERFPVGRRLAFDAERGRLWVVCRKCERWNLSPLEERWEAIEECERRFRDTRLRVSTDNVGLARLPDGLELVRIGRPQRPELAAWRYGDQFGRRRRRNLIRAGVGLGAVGVVVAGGVAAGVGIGGFGWYLVQLTQLAVKGSPNKVVARLTTEDGQPFSVKRRDLDEIRLSADSADAQRWSLLVSGSSRGTRSARSVEHRVLFEGSEALAAARLLLPHVNRYGGAPKHVKGAVELLDEAAAPEALYRRIAKSPIYANRIAQLPDPVRLALEMAANEETERRAMEGELARLEQAWKDAEEIAAISDTLLVPESVSDFLRRGKR